MYGISTYIWLIFMVNVGKYTIHGSYGYLSKIKWNLTNGPTFVSCDRAIRYSGLGVRSVGPVGDFLEYSSPISFLRSNFS